MNATVAFTSLGCDKNRVDSEVMLGILCKNGYRIVTDEKEAFNYEDGSTISNA